MFYQTKLSSNGLQGFVRAMPNGRSTFRHLLHTAAKKSISTFFALVLICNHCDALSVDPYKENEKLWEKSAHCARQWLDDADKDAFIDPSVPLENILDYVKDLGEGSLSTIKLYQDHRGRLIAVKEQFWCKEMERQFSQAGHDVVDFMWNRVKKEFNIGMSLDHENILEINHLVWKELPGEQKPRNYQLMQYIDGDILLYHLSDGNVARHVIQAIDALDHILSSKFVPDDFHSGNFMIDSDGNFIWIDLGGFEDLGSEEAPSSNELVHEFYYLLKTLLSSAESEDVEPLREVIERHLIHFEKISRSCDSRFFYEPITEMHSLYLRQCLELVREEIINHASSTL